VQRFNPAPQHNARSTGKWIEREPRQTQFSIEESNTGFGSPSSLPYCSVVDLRFLSFNHLLAVSNQQIKEQLANRNN
jgi:hypothetical protein